MLLLMPSFTPCRLCVSWRAVQSHKRCSASHGAKRRPVVYWGGIRGAPGWSSCRSNSSRRRCCTLSTAVVCLEERQAGVPASAACVGPYMGLSSLWWPVRYVQGQSTVSNHINKHCKFVCPPAPFRAVPRRAAVCYAMPCYVVLCRWPWPG